MSARSRLHTAFVVGVLVCFGIAQLRAQQSTPAGIEQPKDRSTLKEPAAAPNLIGSASVPAYQLATRPKAIASQHLSMQCRQKEPGSTEQVCEDNSIRFTGTQTDSSAKPDDRLVSADPSDAQTLAETVAYIVTGGFVALGDMKIINDDTVETPQYMRGLFTLMSANRIQVADKNTCTMRVETNPQVSQGIREFTLFLNNVVLPDTIRRQASSEIVFRGDDNVVCVRGIRTGCVREYTIDVRPDNFRRIENAIAYLYRTYCKPALRKGGF